MEDATRAEYLSVQGERLHEILMLSKHDLCSQFGTYSCAGRGELAYMIWVTMEERVLLPKSAEWVVEKASKVT